MQTLTKHEIELTPTGLKNNYDYTDSTGRRYRTWRNKGKGWCVAVEVEGLHKDGPVFVTIAYRVASKLQAQATIANDSNRRLLDPTYETEAERTYWDW